MEEKETIERSKKDQQKITMMCYNKNITSKISSGIASRKNLPTKAVNKCATYISIRPSVGPLTAGRMRVLVKKLDARNQIFKLSIAYRSDTSENSRKIMEQKTSVKKKKWQ